MNMTRFLLILGGILFITACSSRRSYYTGTVKEFENFEIKEKITGELLPISAPGTFTVAACDTLLLVSTDRNPNSFLDIYSLKTYDHLGTFCHKGKGPQEIMAYIHFEQFYKNEQGDLIIPIFDYMRKVGFMNLTQSIKVQSTIFEQKIEWPKEFTHNAGIFWLSEDSILIKYASRKYDARDWEYNLPYTSLWVNGKEEKTYSFHKDPVDSPLFSAHYDFFYNGMSALRPDHTKIAEGIQGIDYLNITDLGSGKTIGSKPKNSLSFEQVAAVQDPELLETYYMNVACSQKFIFGLLMRLNHVDVDESAKLRIFDWEGNAKAEIDLGQKLLYISFNSADNCLYGNDGQEHIYRYDLSLILNKLQ